VDGRHHAGKGQPASLTVEGYVQVIKTFCRWLDAREFLVPGEGVRWGKEGTDLTS
jgi:hypothetical protein